MRISNLAVAATLMAVCLITAAGCAHPVASTPVIASTEPALDEWLNTPRRVMWVAAHPDDEGFAGAILAKAGRGRGGALYFLVLTDAAGGECCIPGGCVPDLATVRAGEIAQSARLYGATLQHESYWNAPLPGSSFPPREVIAQKWRDRSDPTLVIAKAIREFRPDAVLTLGSHRGGTGHPEHQLAARFALAATRLAAGDDPRLPGSPFRVERNYFVLNDFWLSRMMGVQDPESVTETFDVHQSCWGGRSCLDVAAQITRVHQSQANDMKGMRLLFKQLDALALHRVNLNTERDDPYEPVGGGGMHTNP